MEEFVTEEESFPYPLEPKDSKVSIAAPISVCKCLLGSESSEKVILSERKQNILLTVARTESYLRDRRIPELIRFLLTKVIADGPSNPIAFLEKLLDDCMLFRAGHGVAPVLFETRHLEAILKSFDPGNRGWLSSGQVQRAYITVGCNCSDDLNEKNATDAVLSNLKHTQEQELYELLSAGLNIEESTPDCSSSSY